MKQPLTLVISSIMLGLLLLLSFISLYLPQNTKSKALYQIAVVFNNDDASIWNNTRQGMELAATEFGAELRFIMLSSENNFNEQKEHILTEAENGADAIILAPCTTTYIADAVHTASRRAKIVTLETNMAAFGASGCISVDNIALGTSLGVALLNAVSEGETALLLDYGQNGAYIQRLNAAEDVLQENGRRCVRCYAGFGNSISQRLRMDISEYSPAAVAAFSPAVLTDAAAILAEIPAHPLLYGVGATNITLAYLEQNHIISILAQNDFATGYLAVETAITSVERNPLHKVQPMEYYFVRKETMHSKELEKVLFPVTR